MGEPARKMDERYTYADYKTWPADSSEAFDFSAVLPGFSLDIRSLFAAAE